MDILGVSFNELKELCLGVRVSFFRPQQDCSSITIQRQDCLNENSFAGRSSGVIYWHLGTMHQKIGVS